MKTYLITNEKYRNPATVGGRDPFYIANLLIADDAVYDSAGELVGVRLTAKVVVDYVRMLRFSDASIVDEDRVLVTFPHAATDKVYVNLRSKKVRYAGNTYEFAGILADYLGFKRTAAAR